MKYFLLMTAVDDGSWALIETLSKTNKEVKGIRFQRNYGKSQALNAAFKEASGDVVITMDADLQDSPDEIPDLFNMIKGEDFDLDFRLEKETLRFKDQKEFTF